MSAKGKGRPGYYQDLVWTPELATQQACQRQKVAEMCRALFRALDQHGGQAVTLSTIGSDFKVAQLKKDPQFKNVKLVEIFKMFEDVFEVMPDEGGSFKVRLQPGAQAALPDVEQMMEQELQEEVGLALPDRIENPRTTKEKMQSLRIELLYALARRGRRVPLQELGQEPRVQQRKQGLGTARKLVDFVKIFPSNFRVIAEEGLAQNMIVELASTDVKDQYMIDLAIVKNQQAMQQMSEKGARKGSGRGAGASGGRSGSASASASMPQMMLPAGGSDAYRMLYASYAQQQDASNAAALGALVQGLTAQANAAGMTGFSGFSPGFSTGFSPPSTGFSPASPASTGFSPGFS